jgi:hypothetical protein
MSEFIVTLVLIGFVVGGGLFIFWPDLVSTVKKPKREKAKREKALSIESIYEKHYSKEDELIEASKIMERYGDIHKAKEAIEERGSYIKRMMRDTSKYHHCPVCGSYNSKSYDDIHIQCECDAGKFRRAAKEMFKDAGHQIW